MKSHRFNRAIRWALSAVCLSTMISNATAGSFTRGCAARDLQILMLIEERESADAIAAEKVSEALLTMMDARMVCYQGRVVDALAIYENIAHSLTSPPSYPTVGADKARRSADARHVL
jgi:hypothetical protein